MTESASPRHCEGNRSRRDLSCTVSSPATASSSRSASQTGKPCDRTCLAAMSRPNCTIWPKTSANQRTSPINIRTSWRIWRNGWNRNTLHRHCSPWHPSTINRCSSSREVAHRVARILRSHRCGERQLFLPAPQESYAAGGHPTGGPAFESTRRSPDP